jgi:hypothetical protein
MLLDSPILTIRRARGARGQTLIIALIVLGLLLILGFVFLGIVDGNIRGGASAKVRSQSNDLAEAGIRFAQQQLVYSPAGADWRGVPSTLTPVPSNTTETSGTYLDYTYDPDALYLRGPALGSNGAQLPFPGTANLADLGGPDGLGPFIRISYDGGRALVRVRVGLSDANIFASSPTGPLRYPGKVHNYLIVESIGREGVVNLNDPTTFLGTKGASFNQSGVQFQGYTDEAQLQTALATMKQLDSQIVNSRYLRAFATTGLLDNAHFITNKFNVSRAADIGYPNPIENGAEVLPGVGVDYNLVDVGSQLTYYSGSSTNLAAPSSNPVPGGFGSLYSNASVNFHGNLSFNLNDALGDHIAVAGNILADDNSSLDMTVSEYNPATGQWTQGTPTAFGSTQLDSRSTSFTTNNGLLLDGYSGTDAAGLPRGVGRLVPPSILQVDPQTGTNRYLALTRDTMGNLGAPNASTGITPGAAGEGNGIYVANTLDIQAPLDEAGRAGGGSTQSDLYDMFNPNNNQTGSAWSGPFYIPPAAIVNFLTDGFTIQLDKGQTWPVLNPNTNYPTTRRYRIGRYNGQLTIVDSAQDPTEINSTAPNFAAGQAFNGVLYFEGNVRVRGQIPTDAQLTLVSGANIYIDGSITKGVVGNDITDSYPSSSAPNGPYLAYGKFLARPSKSALMLMAREYVAVNTTMFVGPETTQSPVVFNDLNVDNGYSPIVMSAAQNATNGEIDLTGDLNTDPTSGTSPVANGGTAPDTQVAYAKEYVDSITGQPMNTKLMLTHTKADGAGSATIFGMNINIGVGSNAASSQFYFPGSPGMHLPNTYPEIDNTASDYLQSGNKSILQYGLGAEPWQQYVKYESRGFDIVYPTSTTYYPTAGLLDSSSGSSDPYINYTLLAPGSNEFAIHASSINGVPTNDYLLARAALVPGDVRIEASIFAEEGSFVVIPGPWFNPNSEDIRTSFNNDLQTNGQYQADLDRLTKFGNAPEVPFYGEPIDVRVQILGSVSENMPPPLSVQAVEFQKWGWIPVQIGSSTLDLNIPIQHNPTKSNTLVPNFTISYDPDIATGRIEGFSGDNSTGTYIRTDSYGRPLLPMPRLPVSPNFTFFGDMQ